MKKLLIILVLVFLNSINSYGGVFIIQNDYPELNLAINLDGRDIFSISPSICLFTGEKGLGDFEDVFLRYTPRDSKGCANIASILNCGKSYRLNIKNLFGDENQIISQPLVFDFGKDELYITIEKIVFPLKDKNSAPLIKNSNIDTFHAVISKAALNGVELSKTPRDIELRITNILEQDPDKDIYCLRDKDAL